MEELKGKKLKAVNNYVTISIPESTEVMVGDLYLSEEAEKKNRWGDVLSVGPGVVDFNGERVPLPVVIGDKVYASSHGHEEIDLSPLGSDQKVTCVSIMDVLAVLKDLDTLEIQPLGAFVEVEKVGTDVELEGGLLLPDDRATIPNMGKVISLGTGWTSVDGKPIPFDVEVGEYIIFIPFNERVINFNTIGKNVEKYLVFHGDILGVLK